MSLHALRFVDASRMTAMYVVKFAERANAGLLPLRDVKDGETEASDLPILKEWKSARALLTQIRNEAAGYFDGHVPTLGKAWLEILPPMAGTPWSLEAGDYADTHVRTRTCLIPSPAALSFAGPATPPQNLLVGVVHIVDHRQLCSEVNLGEHTRVHLVVDVRVPDAVLAPAADAADA